MFPNSKLHTHSIQFVLHTYFPNTMWWQLVLKTMYFLVLCNRNSDTGSVQTDVYQHATLQPRESKVVFRYFNTFPISKIFQEPFQQHPSTSSSSISYHCNVDNLVIFRRQVHWVEKISPVNIIHSTKCYVLQQVGWVTMDGGKTKHRALTQETGIHLWFCCPSLTTQVKEWLCFGLDKKSKHFPSLCQCWLLFQYQTKTMIFP